MTMPRKTTESYNQSKKEYAIEIEKKFQELRKEILDPSLKEINKLLEENPSEKHQKLKRDLNRQLFLEFNHWNTVAENVEAGLASPDDLNLAEEKIKEFIAIFDMTLKMMKVSLLEIKNINSFFNFKPDEDIELAAETKQILDEVTTKIKQALHVNSISESMILPDSMVKNTPIDLEELHKFEVLPEFSQEASSNKDREELSEFNQEDILSTYERQDEQSSEINPVSSVLKADENNLFHALIRFIKKDLVLQSQASDQYNHPSDLYNQKNQDEYASNHLVNYHNILSQVSEIIINTREVREWNSVAQFFIKKLSKGVDEVIEDIESESELEWEGDLEVMEHEEIHDNLNHDISLEDDVDSDKIGKEKIEPSDSRSKKRARAHDDLEDFSEASEKKRKLNIQYDVDQLNKNAKDLKHLNEKIQEPLLEKYTQGIDQVTKLAKEIIKAENTPSLIKPSKAQVGETNLSSPLQKISSEVKGDLPKSNKILNETKKNIEILKAELELKLRSREEKKFKKAFILLEKNSSLMSRILDKIHKFLQYIGDKYLHLEKNIQNFKAFKSLKNKSELSEELIPKSSKPRIKF